MRKKRLPYFSIIGILSVAIYLCLACQPRKGTQIKHIFLITIDTLRADSLGSYGYPRNTSPFIDSMAENGVLFENVISQSSSTCPSHASIFTGLYPFQHRVLANHYVLEGSHTTLAEMLKKRGFRTTAFTSTDVHFLATRLNQGFEFYEEPIDAFKTYRKKYRPARLTINNAIIWLDNFNSSEKLFMWIHLYDPHDPYYPPPSHVEAVNKNKTEYIEFLNQFNINMDIFKNDINKLYRYRTSYDAEIRYVDEELKRFYDCAEKKGLNKNSLWIITADHGEGLGQHNYLLHSNMIYQEQIHVPLIFLFSNPEIRPKRIGQVVENFNIFPTVLDILDIKIDKKLEKEIHAVSLWPVMRDLKHELIKKFCFSQRENHPPEDPHPKETPFYLRNWEKGDKYSIQDKNYKYIYRTQYKDEFYHLKEDPHEKNNIIYEDIQYKKRLKERLFKYLELLKKYAKKKNRTVDPATVKKLKSLGYIN